MPCSEDAGATNMFAAAGRITGGITGTAIGQLNIWVAQARATFSLLLAEPQYTLAGVWNVTQLELASSPPSPTCSYYGFSVHGLGCTLTVQASECVCVYDVAHK